MQRPPPPKGAGPSLRLKTPSFAHHSLAFSPFFEDRIAVASGANFGLVGNGRLHVIGLSPAGLQVMKVFDTQDSVYDVAWNESHESLSNRYGVCRSNELIEARNQVMAACGNGSLRLFDLTLEGLPTKVWHEHSAEAVSVDWNNLEKNTFVTGSWDSTIKIWSVQRSSSILTIPAHTGQIYSTTWSPHTPSMLASCAADGLVKIFDIRTQTPQRPIQVFQASPTEVLSCDWNKYDLSTLASGGKDLGVKIWDMRSGRSECVSELRGHTLAVKKVQWSPHHRDVLASASYDMTCRSWNTMPPSARTVHSDHSEFCMGAAWALFDRDLLASCAWDQEVHLFRA